MRAPPRLAHFLCAGWLLREWEKPFQDGHFGFAPASLSEHDNGTGAALEGSLNSTDSNGLRGVTGQMSDAAQLLKHLSVEHRSLGFTSNLDTWKNDVKNVNDRRFAHTGGRVRLLK